MQTDSSQHPSPHPIDVEIGARVRERRNTLGLSQAQLGQRLSLTFQQVQKYENGSNRITVSRLWMIAQALDISIVEFVRDLPGGHSDHVEGTEKSTRLVTAWRQLRSPLHRTAIIDLVESLSDGRRSDT